MEAGGSEHPTLAPPKTPISGGGGAKCGARDAQKHGTDPDLVLIQERWPGLPEHIRAAVMALVRNAGGAR